MDAPAWRIFALNETIEDLSMLPGTPIYEGDTMYEYRIFYRHPNRSYSDYQQSDRGIQSSATCEQLDVQGDVFSRDTLSNLNVSLSGSEWFEVEIPTWGDGMVSYTGLTQKSKGDPRFCGPRCASISVFQKLDAPAPCDWCSISFSRSDRMRLIDISPEVCQALLARIGQEWASKVSECSAGIQEIKFHGYPWAAGWKETMRVRELLLTVPGVLEEGWTVYANIDQSASGGNQHASETDTVSLTPAAI